MHDEVEAKLLRIERNRIAYIIDDVANLNGGHVLLFLSYGSNGLFSGHAEPDCRQTPQLRVKGFARLGRFRRLFLDSCMVGLGGLEPPTSGLGIHPLGFTAVQDGP